MQHFRRLFIIFVCLHRIVNKLVSDPTSRRFIRWLLFQTFKYIYTSRQYASTKDIILVLYVYLCLFEHLTCYLLIFIKYMFVYSINPLHVSDLILKLDVFYRSYLPYD